MKNLLRLIHRIIQLLEEILTSHNDRQESMRSEKGYDLISDLIDNVDVKEMLKISDSTLYRLRKDKLIATIRIGKRDYYSLTQIKKIKL